MTTPHTTGKYFLFSRSEGEIFLGRAIDETLDGRLPLEGKSFCITSQGTFAAKPFRTRIDIAETDIPHRIEHPDAIDEAEALLTRSVTIVHRTNFPLLFRWFQAGKAAPAARTPVVVANPFAHIFRGFETNAELFRRALFAAPQVRSTRELDRLTELEGDLVIELGKVTNDVAVRFNAIVAGDVELTGFFEQLGAGGITVTNGGVGGWTFAMARLFEAKSWARGRGKVHLVRDVNTLAKEGIGRMNDVLLEHAGALDTLITETFAQFGIEAETWGEISPFATYTMPMPGRSLQESAEPEVPLGASAI